MRFLLIVFALSLASTTAAQGGDVWVSLGSFRTVDAAESARSAASQVLLDAVQVARAETSSGVVYRVVAGPFAGRRAALERVPDIQANGFKDAWVVPSAQVALMQTAALDAGPAMPPPEADDMALDDYDLDDYDLDDYDLDDYDLDDYDLDDYDLDADLPINDLLNLDELDLPDLDLGDVPGLTAPAQRDPTIKPTEEPAFEAPQDYQLHKLKRRG